MSPLARRRLLLMVVCFPLVGFSGWLLNVEGLRSPPGIGVQMFTI